MKKVEKLRLFQDKLAILNSLIDEMDLESIRDFIDEIIQIAPKENEHEFISFLQTAGDIVRKIISVVLESGLAGEMDSLEKVGFFQIDSNEFVDSDEVYDVLHNLEILIAEELMGRKKEPSFKGNTSTIHHRIPQPCGSTDTDLETIKSAKELIKEHAARRVDYFFYTLVALYNKKIRVIALNTHEQFGMGSKATGTEACHSTFFGKLVSSKGVKLFEGTHFQAILNATVILPERVNDYDRFIDGHIGSLHEYREICLKIVNAVSFGRLTPISGMRKFFELTHIFFNLAENDTKIPQDEPVMEIHNYYKESMLLPEKNTITHELKDEYIHLMLRIKEDEMQGKSKQELQKLYLKKCAEIQDEIYNSKFERDKGSNLTEGQVKEVEKSLYNNYQIYI